MSGAEQIEPQKWVYSTRVIFGDILDRARWRNLLTYQLHPRFLAGIEINPLANDVHPVANWTVVTETETRPALMVGTSSDRIGTPHGTAVFATISKDLERWIKVPLAPYVGASYGSYDSEVVPIAGGTLRLGDEFAAGVIFDGHKAHPTLTWTKGRHQIGAMLAFGKKPGLFYSIRF